MGLRGGDPMSVLDAISNGRTGGRLDRGFSCHGITLYSNDIVPELHRAAATPREVPERLHELLDAGLDEFAANGVMVAEVALIAAELGGKGVAAIGPHLAGVLTDLPSPRRRVGSLRPCPPGISLAQPGRGDDITDEGTLPPSGGTVCAERGLTRHGAP